MRSPPHSSKPAMATMDAPSRYLTMTLMDPGRSQVPNLRKRRQWPVTSGTITRPNVRTLDTAGLARRQHFRPSRQEDDVAREWAEPCTRWGTLHSGSTPGSRRSPTKVKVRSRFSSTLIALTIRYGPCIFLHCLSTPIWTLKLSR